MIRYISSLILISFLLSSLVLPSPSPYETCSFHNLWAMERGRGVRSVRRALSRVHGVPDLLGGERQIEVQDPEGLQGVHHCVRDRRGGGNGCRLADALHAERVERRRRLRPVRL